MLERLEHWLTKAVAFYQPRGFFRQYPGDIDDVVDKLFPFLEAQNEHDEFSALDLESPEFDLFFLSLDNQRTLYDSMDFGSALVPGGKAYVATVEALARISRGVFAPSNVSERWETTDGPIVISFQLEGKEHSLKVDTWDGMFDFRILLQINLLLKNTPHRFEMAPLDDILFITVLTAEEKMDLERHRNLAFMVLDLSRKFFPMHTLTAPLQLPTDPEAPTFYCGTLNEYLDRCVGRLRFIVRGDTVEGHHLYQGVAHQEDFRFEGTLDRTNSRLRGQLRGHITVGDEPRAYRGEWEGKLAPGNRVATGTWRGWFEDESDPDSDASSQISLEEKIYKGQWGLLEEESCQAGDPYIARTREWLEMVWESRDSEDYPWLLPT